MRKYICFALFQIMVLIPFYADAQEVLTIERCYELARVNYPLVKQYDLIGITEEYTLKNAHMMLFPQISISGRATYQTHALEFPFTIPGEDIPEYSKDQYQAALELSQVIWDGGQIRAQKKNIVAKADVSREQYNVDMYALRERVNNLFFGLLLLKEQISQVNILLDYLQTNYHKIEQCIRNGVANQSDLDVIEVEQIANRQKKAELELLRDAYLRMFSLMMGEEVDENTILVKPVPDAMKNKEMFAKLIMSQNDRPELKVFDAQEKEIRTQWDYWVAGGLPKVKLFITGAYGRPGLNFLSNSFDFYAIGGVKLSWNLSELYSLNFGKKVIESSIHQVETGRQTFLFNANLQSEQQIAEIRKYVRIMEDDESVIRLREKIRQAAEVEVLNGTMSAADLITEINKEEISKQQKIVHEIELIKSIYELKTIKNY